MKEKQQESPERQLCTPLLFTSKGTTMLQNFIQSTKVAIRKWLLQGGSENDRGDEWGWGRLGESAAGDGEAEGQERS